MTNTTRRPSVKLIGRSSALVVAGVLLAMIACFAWVGVRGALAYQHLSRVQDGAKALTSSLMEDPGEASSRLAELASEARAARELTDDPVWAFTSAGPWVGPQLTAFKTVVDSTDETIGDGLLPLARAAGDISIDVLRPTDGRFSAAALSSLAQPAKTSAERVAHSAAAVRDIDRTALIGQLARAVDQAEAVFGNAEKSVDALARTAQLLPAMLGQDRPRDYLVLVQNNSEWRSLGGISGTAFTIRTEGGVVTTGGTQSATSLSRGITAPISDLGPEVTAIYGTQPTRFFHNLTQIPDFAIDGALARTMYAQQTGVEVDGVIALDPVGLSYLIGATGPLTLPGGDRITADNTTQMLLSTVYQRYAEPSEQDAFFAQTSEAVFAALLKGSSSPAKVLSALTRAGDEGRLLLWSADNEEQAVLDGSTIAGPLPQTDDRSARFGVYLNDGTGSKMSYYMKPTVTLEWNACLQSASDTSRQATLRLDLSNTAPADAATVLPPYVTGNGRYGVPPGTVRTVVNVFVPLGFEIVAAETTNASSVVTTTMEGRSVLTFSADTAPGSSITASVAVRGMSSATTIEARVTPTADAALDPIVRTRCDESSSLSGTLR